MRQDRLLEIVGRIYQRPEIWDQHCYMNECDTAFCVAGHAQNDSGYGPNIDHWKVRLRTVRSDAINWLDLGEDEAHWLFGGDRTLPELIHFATTGKRP